jgi:predicted amidohydrolase
MTMNVGLVIAQQDKKLDELRRFILSDQAESIDLFLFPECYLNVSQLKDASKIVASAKKWLVTSYTNDSKKDKYETGVVFGRTGDIVGEHSKTTPTGGERRDGFLPGKDITAIDTEFGKIGVCVCYEMHFPEIAREYRLQGAKLIFNPIGTGMFDEEQYKV